MSRLSPTAWPFQPNTATRASLFNLIKFNLPSLDPKHCGFLSILDEPNTLPDRRLWLFGFILYFSENNSLFMRRTAQELGLQGGTQVGFLVLFILPLLVPLVTLELPGCLETTTLSPSCQSHGPKCKKVKRLIF